MLILMSLVASLATLVFVALLIRAAAGANFLWTFVPANTVAFVTPRGEKTGDLTKGGGGVEKIIHNVPGKRLNTENRDPEEWFLEDGEEERGFLFYLLGVTWIGFFRTLRTNKVRRFRYTKKDSDPKEYHVLSDDLETKFVPFAGDQAIEIKGIETDSIFTIDISLNIIDEIEQPLKAVVRVADSNSVLTSTVKQKVNSLTGTREAEHFLKRTSDRDQELIGAVLSARDSVLGAVGRKISFVSIIQVDPNEDDRDLMELKERREREGDAEVVKADREAKARVLRAEGEKKAKTLLNDADADRVERVIKPTAENDRTVAVAQAEAYRFNEKVTVVGATPMITVEK